MGRNGHKECRSCDNRWTGEKNICPDCGGWGYHYVSVARYR